MPSADLTTLSSHASPCRALRGSAIASTATGIDEIRERFRKGWQQPLPDLELDVLSVEVDGSAGRATWECRSPALPGPVRGEDLYEIRDEKIARLDVRVTDGLEDLTG